MGTRIRSVLDQIAKQLIGPIDAAFKEGKAQLREAPGDAAEENRLGGRMPSRGEMADVAVGEFGRRQAQAPVEAGAVEGWRDAQFHAFGPDRVVVVEGRSFTS